MSSTSTGGGGAWTPMPDELNRRGLFEAHVVRGIAERLRVQWLLRHFDERKVWAAFMFVNGFITIALLVPLIAKLSLFRIADLQNIDAVFALIISVKSL